MRPSPKPDNETRRLRLDLFLKRSRLVKRRSLAATLCENGYVALNGRPAQPGRTVREGDRIEVRYARKKLLVQVTGIPGKGGKGEFFRVIREEPVEEIWD
ncbi:MAG: RNA-binding S4 domain-containing protein [bacterium]|nr:MAG: RNA-binding S4 domain-containing protein [bacterium]